jgi:hypothetical protein
MSRLIDQEWTFEKNKHEQTYEVWRAGFRPVATNISRREDALAISAVPKMLAALRRAYFLTSQANIEPHEMRKVLAEGIYHAERKDRQQ